MYDIKLNGRVAVPEDLPELPFERLDDIETLKVEI